MIRYEMGSRYFITGVQLGILKALSEMERMKGSGLDEYLDEIFENQYLCNIEELKEKEITTRIINKLRQR